MKHAFLITVYKDFNMLYDVLNIYTQEYDIDCYVHIDRKSVISTETLNKLKSLKNVIIIQKYKVNWGSYLHLKAFMELLQIANMEKRYDFYHFLSANTFLAAGRDKFHSYFENHKANNFIDVISFVGTESEKDIRKWYQYYRYPFLYDKKGNHHIFWDNFEMYFVRAQEKMGMKRKVSFDYKGYVYCHINGEFAAYVLAYLKNHPKYMKQLKYCHVGEEFFFQNIFMNSKYKDTLINDSLIYDDWSDENERPRILKKCDYDKVIESDKLFIRKIEENEESCELMKCIHKKNIVLS